MKRVIFGGSGLIGTALRQTHEYRQGVRREPHAGAFFWDPSCHQIDAKYLEGVDVVINLCGANVASWPWTRRYRRTLIDSRVSPSRCLVDTMAGMSNPPKHYIQASAIGFYGTNRQEVLTEESARGSGFLSDLCEEWEACVSSLKDTAVRTTLLRFGMVLSRKGGALAKMEGPFSLGLGGRLGDGQQMCSWIALEEIPRIIEHVWQHQIQGCVNVVSPSAVSNQEFTQMLGQVLRRPTRLSVPRWLLKALLGQMAESILLSSLDVRPQVLMDSGYVFMHRDLCSYLDFLYAR